MAGIHSIGEWEDDFASCFSGIGAGVDDMTAAYTWALGGWKGGRGLPCEIEKHTRNLFDNQDLVREW